MRTTTRLAAAAAVGAAALAFAGAAPATAASSNVSLSVLHGVPDTTVDVYLDGDRALNDFEPGDLAGPLSVPSGKHTIAITAADADNDDDPVIGPIDVTLDGGKSYTAAAHLTADGKPGATLFTNDTSELAAGKGRLTVRHTAAAPAGLTFGNTREVADATDAHCEATVDLLRVGEAHPDRRWGGRVLLRA